MDLAHRLKDIKPNIELYDYWFYAFIAFCVVLTAVLIFFLYRRFRKKPDPYLLKLKNLNFSNSKKTAYEFCEYAKKFVTDENKNEYEHIAKLLERYKYRPNVDQLKEEEIKMIKKFIEEIK